MENEMPKSDFTKARIAKEVLFGVFLSAGAYFLARVILSVIDGVVL